GTVVRGGGAEQVLELERLHAWRQLGRRLIERFQSCLSLIEQSVDTGSIGAARGICGIRLLRRRELLRGFGLTSLLRLVGHRNPFPTQSSFSETRPVLQRSTATLPLNEIELAEQHFFEQRLAQCAVGFLQ